MKYTYEATYEDCSPDGTVRVSAEVRFTYTVTWGCDARIRYDEHDYPAEGDELEVVNTEIEETGGIFPRVSTTWRKTNSREHEILCSWVDNSVLHELMLEDAREQDASAEEDALEHAAETRADLRRMEDD